MLNGNDCKRSSSFLERFAVIVIGEVKYGSCTFAIPNHLDNKNDMLVGRDFLAGGQKKMVLKIYTS